MASPNTTFTTGQVLTSAQANNFPFGVAGRVINTSLSQIVTTMTDLTSMSVTFTGVATRLYHIEGRILASSAVAADAANLIIRDSSNNILQQGIGNLQVASQAYTFNVSHILAVTGSFTVKLSMQRQAGTGVITAIAGATFPAFICVTDLGIP